MVFDVWDLITTLTTLTSVLSKPEQLAYRVFVSFLAGWDFAAAST